MLSKCLGPLFPLKPSSLNLRRVHARAAPAPSAPPLSQIWKSTQEVNKRAGTERPTQKGESEMKYSHHHTFRKELLSDPLRLPELISELPALSHRVSKSEWASVERFLVAHRAKIPEDLLCDVLLPACIPADLRSSEAQREAVPPEFFVKGIRTVARPLVSEPKFLEKLVPTPKRLVSVLLGMDAKVLLSKALPFLTARPDIEELEKQGEAPGRVEGIEEIINAISPIAAKFEAEEAAQLLLWATQRTHSGCPPELVRLFSEKMSQEIEAVKPRDLVRFARAVGSSKEAVDEFWMFLMAKRVQDDINCTAPENGGVERNKFSRCDYTAEMVVQLARCFSERGLEDQDFYEALAARILDSSLPELSLIELLQLTYGLSRVRFRHESLATYTFQRMGETEGRAAIRKLDLSSTIKSLAAFATLDLGTSAGSGAIASLFSQLSSLLKAAPHAMRRELEQGHNELIGLSLALCRLGCPEGEVDGLLPLMVEAGIKKKQGAIKRRMLLMAHSAALGCFPPSTLRGIAGSKGPAKKAVSELKAFRERYLALEASCQEGTKGGNGVMQSLESGVYFPASSGFHLEVAVVLKLMDISHDIEVKCAPFIFDISNIGPIPESEGSVDEMIHRRRRQEAIMQWALEEQDSGAM